MSRFADVELDCINDFLAGTNARPLSAGSANIIDIFAGATKILMDRDVEMMGDLVAVITPKIAADIAKKATSVGFNFADAALKNGLVGQFMGYKVYVSNNLPSGKCSAIGPGAGGTTASAISATSCKAIYFGRAKMIDVAMQRAPTFQINKCEDKLGYNYITSVVWGATVTTRNRSRGINAPVQSSYF